MLIVMDKGTHEEHLFQPLQTKNKHFKIAVFLTGLNGIYKNSTKTIKCISQNQLLKKMVLFK